MIYRKIRVGLSEYKSRFYRVVLVRADVSLYELGVVLGTALGVEFEHMFMFRSGKNIYCDPTWIDNDNEYSYYDKKLKDLNKNFKFIYDTGDDWEFDGTINDKEFEIDSKEIAFLEDGKGQGLWEDNKYNLIRYFDGEIAPDAKENEEKGIFYPWNYTIKKFSDFDTGFNLKAVKEDFAEEVEDNIYYLKEARDEVSEFLPDLDDEEEFDHMSAYDGAFDRVCEYIASYQIMMDDEVEEIFDDLCEKLGEEEAMRKIISVVKDELDEYIDSNEMLKNHSYFTKLYEIDDEVYS